MKRILSQSILRLKERQLKPPRKIRTHSDLLVELSCVAGEAFIVLLVKIGGAPGLGTAAESSSVVPRSYCILHNAYMVATFGYNYCICIYIYTIYMYYSGLFTMNEQCY